nr:hypothetical protein [Actinomadura sp. J1-007]
MLGRRGTAVGVHAEAERHDDLLGDVEAPHGREARHVLLGRAEAGLVAAQEDVGAAVHEDHRVGVERLHEVPVRGAERLDAEFRERVDGRGQALAVQPARQRALGEVPVAALGLGRHRDDVLTDPRVGRQAVEGAERQVRQVDVLAVVHQREGQRQAREHVETAAGTGDQGAAGFLQACEQGWFLEREHPGTVPVGSVVFVGFQ